MDKIRILRVIEYIGEPEAVYNQLEKNMLSNNGQKEYNGVVMKSALVGDIPEIINEKQSDKEVIEKTKDYSLQDFYNDLTTIINNDSIDNNQVALVNGTETGYPQKVLGISLNKSKEVQINSAWEFSRDKILNSDYGIKTGVRF